MSEHAPQQPQYQSYPQPGPPAQAAPGGFLPSGPDRPTPVGLGLAGVGLLLLAVGSLIPQISLGGSDGDDIAGSALETAGVSLPGLPPALVLVVLVGWAAAGVRPNLQWAAKLGGIGLAALTAAAALHPVIELNGVFGSDAWEEAELDVEASAGGGIWLFILAAALLAVSIFLMRWAPPKQPAQQQFYQQPGQQPGPQPTVQQPAAPQQNQQQGNGWPGMTQQ
ncbi:hypothetical protein LO763_16420 [Glycomyces sp. A-F 0318]|uniref:hypothetical protein n=1 Tax=Glycomyces amatae TaxID=2881355 RepID=UPI001E29AD01|nr:hypothetical protein [Glycomyces amatae]MCD0445202.1 hypothetical protein [Glycomyces amatae]